MSLLIMCCVVFLYLELSGRDTGTPVENTITK